MKVVLGFYALIGNLLWVVDGQDNFEYAASTTGETIKCGKVQMVLHAQRQEVKCMPRATMVKLTPEYGYEYHPDVVPVRRCQGHCYNGMSCLPVKKKTTSVIVKREYKWQWMSCLKIEVEEHTQCKCSCAVKETHCNRKQVYVPESCTCRCMNDDEKEKCMKQSNMIWDATNCKCICGMKEEECSTNLEWIPSLCRCAEVII